MFLLLFGPNPSLLLLNYSKIEPKTPKEMKLFGELLKDHQSSKNPARAGFFFALASRPRSAAAQPSEPGGEDCHGVICVSR